MTFEKNFDYQRLEPAIYKIWLETNSFKTKLSQKPKFSIVMPPPNANESLHCGHALYLTYQDFLVRFYRLLGYDVSYFPGTDHAGIETQVVFEHKLEQDGKSRNDYTKSEIYQMIADYVDKNKDLAIRQMEALGVSADWNMLNFTLDPKVIKLTTKTLKKMQQDGLLYRDDKIVNYSPKYQTTFSSLEIKHKTIESSLWEIKYFHVNNPKLFLTIATTRPETIFGDTAIAVHPNDPRFKNLLGELVKVPLINREIPIIADNAVDPKFGTGAVKVTPAHDPNDFQIGKRHHLQRITILDKDARLSGLAVPSEYLGLSVMEAREQIIKDLNHSHSLGKIKNYRHEVAFTAKGDDQIQPILMKQWFVRMDSFAQKLIGILESRQIEFKPRGYKKALLNWLLNIEDWNISRQIVWGIRMPIYYAEANPEEIFIGEPTEAKAYFGEREYRQETDVFDTWFSSSHWPLVVTDYPSEYADQYLPTDVLGTGKEIIFLWVARMIVLSDYIAKKLPFKTVYINGYITDEKGIKMSKSKFNGINPLEVSKDYGADALRLSLMSGNAAGVNQSLSLSKIAGYRSFITKLYNIAKYINMNDGELAVGSIYDDWILDKMQSAQKNYINNVKNLRLGEAVKTIYNFTWHQLADWYLEFSKLNFNSQILNEVFKQTLILLHPTIPFISEYLWQELEYGNKNQLLINAELKNITFKTNPNSIAEVELIIATIRKLRIYQKNLPNSKIFIDSGNTNKLTLESVAKLSKIQVFENSLSDCQRLIINKELDINIIIDSASLKVYSNKLLEELSSKSLELEKISNRLSNPGYLKNAPKNIINLSKESMRKIQTEIINIKQTINEVENADR